MTWFDTKVNYFWEFVVTLMPKTIAPNLMTFVGWCFIIASYANMLRYDLTFDKNIPSWCFFFATFCIFSFVTLDAIDGKQARRTKGGSPLGQLFDHGCDSYTMTFLMLGIC
jgi:ethanolaminephosphotransferase